MQGQEQARIQAEQVSDSVLIAQALAGDQRAFEALVQRYQRLLLHSISTYLKDRDQGYDILQQVLLQLYVSLPTLRTSVRIKGWLLQVARNRCLDELRKRRRRPEVYFSELEWNTDEEFSLLPALPDTQPLPEECAEYHDLLSNLKQTMDGLPQAARSVLSLRCIEHLPFSQIGQVLHMPEVTAKTYFYRWRIRLRATLAAQ